MALRRILLAVAGAAAFACSGQAQTIPTVPAYRAPSGQVQDGIGIQTLAPLRLASTVTSISIVAANTFQSALAANNSRNGCLLVNRSLGTMQVYLGAPASASTAASIPLAAGASFNCATAAGVVITDQISVAGGAVGDQLVVITQ